MLRPSVLAVTFAGFVGGAVPAFASKPITPESSLDVRWPAHPTISSDGRVVFEIKDVSLDTGSKTHLYLIEGGRPRAITANGKGNYSAKWSPDGKRLAFVGSRDGEPALLVHESGQMGEPTTVATLSTGIGGPIWSADGKTIVFASTVDPACSDDACNKAKAKKKADVKASARVYDELLYRHWNEWDEGTRSHLFAVPSDGSSPPKDLTRGPYAAPTDILGGGQGYTIADNVVVFTQNRDKDRALSTNNDLYNVALRGGKPERLTTNPAWDANPVASPSGRYVAYVAFKRPGFEADRPVLYIHDRQTSKAEARTMDWDRGVREIAWSPDETTLYVVAYDRAYRQLYRLKREGGGAPEPLVTKRYVSQIDVGGDGSVVFVCSTLTDPPEIWRWDAKTQKAAPLTSINAAFKDATRVGAVEELEATSKDGTKVHGLIVKPPNAAKGQKHPLVVLIHGGPQGAWTSVWHPRWNPQIFAARGYVIALPNPRGSIGYGQDYVDAVTKDWGGGPYEDVMAFTDAAEKLPYVNSKAVCAAGASYGGYMVNWIAGHTDRFDCLITHAGVFNLESMWGDTEELWFPEWEMGGTPWAKRDNYVKWSPHRHIQAAKTPTLVIHGQLDYRVHLSQGQQMHTSLRRLGVPSRFVYFPDEGHWIAKPHNFVFWYGEMLGWLDRYL